MASSHHHELGTFSWILDPAAQAASPASADHAGMDMRDESKVDFPVGPGVDMIAPMPADRVGDPGVGLDDVGHRVLTYRDMVSLRPRTDLRPPSRMIFAGSST